MGELVKKMNFQNKIRIERTKIKIRNAWNEFKDFLLILFLLNLLINLLSSGAMVSALSTNAVPQAIEFTAEAGASKGIVPASAPTGQAEEVKELEQVEELKGVFSAYTASPEETDADPFTMASGKKVYEGAIANNCLPFGTKIEVNGVVKIVEDRMNKRYDCSHFDIFVASKDEAYEIGRKALTYKVVK